MDPRLRPRPRSGEGGTARRAVEGAWAATLAQSPLAPSTMLRMAPPSPALFHCAGADKQHPSRDATSARALLNYHAIQRIVAAQKGGEAPKARTLPTPFAAQLSANVARLLMYRCDKVYASLRPPLSRYAAARHIGRARLPALLLRLLQGIPIPAQLQAMLPGDSESSGRYPPSPVPVQ